MPFKTGTQKKGTPGGDAPSVFSILDKIRSVKNGSTSQEKFSADDMDASGANELRENMTTKEREILRGVETRLLRNIGGALGVTKCGDRNYLKDVIRGLSDAYLETGTIEQQTMDELFEQAYRQGMESSDHSSLSAKHEIEKRYGVKIYPIVNADDIIKAIESGVITAGEYFEELKDYIKQYKGE